MRRGLRAQRVVAALFLRQPLVRQRQRHVIDDAPRDQHVVFREGAGLSSTGNVTMVSRRPSTRIGNSNAARRPIFTDIESAYSGSGAEIVDDLVIPVIGAADTTGRAAAS